MYEKQRSCLIILDGWGHGPNPENSAIAQAKTPFVDSLYQQYPNAELITYGEDVGLPEGQMGNSEVGHLNIGAGRIVYQDLARINKSIKDDTLKEIDIIKDLISMHQHSKKPIHLMGLLSDGGVHSHINHLVSLCNIFSRAKIPVYIHAFLDGRDTSPNGGLSYVQDLVRRTDNYYVKIVTVVGRYFAMDRDNRWERIRKAYDLIIHSNGIHTSDIISEIQASYDAGVTDEFVEPIQLTENNEAIGNIKDGDTVIFFNYRTDRPRQITEVLTQNDKPESEMTKMNLNFVTMTNYNAQFKNIQVLFEKDALKMTLGEFLEKEKRTQLRTAETEKYPHVTFFFSGGRENPFKGESRVLVSSPKVATYDMQPEMSAYELTEKFIDKIEQEHPDFCVINFANTDMVGHTGVFSAAIAAAQAVDVCLSQLVPVLKKNGYHSLVIADHGNADIMVNDDGNAHTAHTLSPVPVILVSDQYKEITDGRLADVAPSIIHLMGLKQPGEMTGKSLIS